MHKKDKTTDVEVASKKQFLSLYKLLQEKYPEKTRILGITLSVLFLVVCNSTKGRKIPKEIDDKSKLHPEIEDQIQIKIKRQLIVEDDLENDAIIKEINQDTFYIPIVQNSTVDRPLDESGLFQVVHKYLNNFIDIKICDNCLNASADFDKTDEMDKNMLGVMCNVYKSLCSEYNFTVNSFEVLRILDVFYYGYNKISLFVDEQYIDSTKTTHIIISKLLSKYHHIGDKLPFIETLDGKIFDLEISKEKIEHEKELCNFIVKIYNGLDNDETTQFK